MSAREIRKAEFKKELDDLLVRVIPKGATSICLITDSNKICRLSTILTPETAAKEFTIKIADIENRGFDAVFNEAWGRAVTEVEREG